MHLAVRDRRITSVTVGNRRLIDPRVADVEWANHTDTTKPRNSVTGNPGGRAGNDNDRVSLHRANTVRAVWNAKIARLEYEERSAKLVPVDAIAARIYAQNRRVRNKLRELPVTLDRRLAGKTAEEVRQLLVAAIDRVCNELADESANGQGPTTADDPAAE